MRILSLDPGAERMGFAVIEGGRGLEPRYLTSGIVSTPRGDKEQYQVYRLRLIRGIVNDFERTLEAYRPEVVVNETVPPIAGGAFASNGVQAQLAATAITAAQTVAALKDYFVEQVSANTVKARIGGKKTATKVGVRNGVYQFFPHLKAERGKEWVKVHDESDAIAVGLTWLGYTAA